MSGIPQGFHTVTPYLFVRGAEEAIAFYKRAFGATEIFMLKRDDGTVRHSEIRIGDSPVMLVDADENFPSINPEHTPIHLHLYVEDIDAFTHQAVEAGATLIMQPEDKDDGERRGGIQDPFGFTWWIATQIKAISREELQKQYDSR